MIGRSRSPAMLADCGASEGRLTVPSLVFVVLMSHRISVRPPSRVSMPELLSLSFDIYGCAERTKWLSIIFWHFKGLPVVGGWMQQKDVALSPSERQPHPNNVEVQVTTELVMPVISTRNASFLL